VRAGRLTPRSRAEDSGNQGLRTGLTALPWAEDLRIAAALAWRRNLVALRAPTGKRVTPVLPDLAVQLRWRGELCPSGAALACVRDEPPRQPSTDVEVRYGVRPNAGCCGISCHLARTGPPVENQWSALWPN